MTAGKYKEAAEIYSRLLDNKQITDTESLAKVRLSYGFSLFMLERTADAQAVLKQTLAAAEQLRSRKRTKDEAIDFEPDRLKFIAYGLLSQIGPAQERAQALEKRIELLNRNQKLTEDWYPAIIRSRVRLAELLSPADLSRAIEHMNGALKLTADFGDDGQFVSPTVFRSLTNYLAHGLLHREAYAQSVSAKDVRETVTKCIAAYDSQKIEQPMLDFQKLKLQVLWAMYSAKVLGQPETAPRDLDSLLSSGRYEKLKESLPEQAAEIQKLAALGKMK
jgi:hypothetical protein